MQFIPIGNDLWVRLLAQCANTGALGEDSSLHRHPVEYLTKRGIEADKAAT